MPRRPNRACCVGAVGLMQIMPKTGRELGVGDVHTADPNVHAGAKYMAQLMDVYFNGVQFDDQNRNLFAYAAYNAGPGKIQSLRREAQAEKLDRICGSTMSSGSRQLGSARKQCDMSVTSTNITSPIS